jgi:ATP synthase protein I
VTCVPLIDEGKPIRTVLRWQIYVTATLALIAGIWGGRHGALSAGLGGLVNLVAGTVFGLIAVRSDKKTAGATLRAALRAEAGKVMLIVIQLWLVLTYYREIVPVAFFATFILTVFVFSMAIFAPER